MLDGRATSFNRTHARCRARARSTCGAPVLTPRRGSSGSPSHPVCRGSRPPSRPYQCARTAGAFGVRARAGDEAVGDDVAAAVAAAVTGARVHAASASPATAVATAPYTREMPTERVLTPETLRK